MLLHYIKLLLTLQLLQDMYTINTRLCRVNNFQTGKPLTLITIEGFCKYGDRCTFAHGEVDMRAKFVPASNMYATATPSVVTEMPVAPVPSNGGIDYSVFSQPIDPMQTMKTPDYGFETQFSYSYGGEHAFYQPPMMTQEVPKMMSKFTNLAIKHVSWCPPVN